jgi:hypothetical protein
MDENIYDLKNDQLNSSNNTSDPAANSNNHPLIQKRKPDADTNKRIAHLAKVGEALKKRADDNSFQTDFLIAREALDDFEAGINELDLDPQASQGMVDLIEYLRKKIQKRLQSSIDLQALK